MAKITDTKNGKYLKKTGADSYVHYQFDTNDGIVYLSNAVGTIVKDTTLHDALTTIYALASKGGQASTDLATLLAKVDAHIADKNNPHGVDKEDVKLGLVVNAPMDTTPTENSNNYVKSGGVYHAIKNVSAKADQAISIANGQSHAYVFADVAGLRSGTLSNEQSISGYKVADSIYIIALDVSDFWISAVASTGTASTADAISSAKKGDTVVVKWGSKYVSLTALESKRDLSGYATTSALNDALRNFYDKTTIEHNYVPYSGAKDNVNLGDHTLTVGNATVQANPINTKIAGGSITLNGLAKLGTTTTNVGRKVEINVTGITVDETKTYKYPLDDSGTLATQEFVTGKGYQTETQVNSSIDTTPLTFGGGDVLGNGNIGDQEIRLDLTDMADLPTAETTFSAVKVNKKGRVTAGGQQIVFASTINDPTLSNLVVGGVAIIDA